MSSTYSLSKTYEQVYFPSKTSTENKPSTIKEAYNAVLSNCSKVQEIQEAAQDLKIPDIQYNQLISKTLFGNTQKINQIPAPVEKYQVGVNVQIKNPDDLKIFKALFPITPPKRGESVEEASAGTKGSGNGEVALYWLLSNVHQVQDMRGGSEPDLKIDGSIGVEVKAYNVKKIGLGRFGDQHTNRKLLSIAFGLRALLNTFQTTEKKFRPVSLDTFNKEELINSFQTVIDFDSNEELRKIAHKYAPIDIIFQQIAMLLNGLGLKTGEYTAKEGAAKLLLALLKTKLAKKPGFGGYLANISEKAIITYNKIDQAYLESLPPDVILDNVNANGAALLIVPENLFSK